jgi:hypothetical protein
MEGKGEMLNRANNRGFATRIGTAAWGQRPLTLKSIQYNEILHRASYINGFFVWSEEIGRTRRYGAFKYKRFYKSVS